jgi:hypothetical protein
VGGHRVGSLQVFFIVEGVEKLQTQRSLRTRRSAKESKSKRGGKRRKRRCAEGGLQALMVGAYNGALFLW